MKNKFVVLVELLPSSGGVFEVAVDGIVVFSKKECKRFPVEGEIVQLVGQKVVVQK